MSQVTEGVYASEFLMSEAPGYRSRDEAVIDSSQTIKAGTVLGQITEGARTAVGAAGVPAPAAATITASPPASLATKVGVHYFVCIVGGSATASKWRHIDPDGDIVGVATGATAYAGGGLSALTIADPGTDPTVGETFTVTVTAVDGSERYVAVAPSAINGSQHACAIAYAPAVTGVGETKRIAVVSRDAEVKLDALDLGALTDDQKAAALVELFALGIVARS